MKSSICRRSWIDNKTSRSLSSQSIQASQTHTLPHTSTLSITHVGIRHTTAMTAWTVTECLCWNAPAVLTNRHVTAALHKHRHLPLNGSRSVRLHLRGQRRADGFHLGVNDSRGPTGGLRTSATTPGTHLTDWPVTYHQGHTQLWASISDHPYINWSFFVPILIFTHWNSETAAFQKKTFGTDIQV